MAFFQAAYVFLWALIFAYTVYLSRRQRRLQEDLDRVQEMVEDRRPR